VSEATEVRVPDIGDFTDVPVIEIHVAPGDDVAVEDPLVTLESDKATMDVPAPSAGKIAQLSVKVGDRVSEGSVLLTLEGSEDGAVADAPEAPEAAAVDPEADDSLQGDATPETRASTNGSPPATDGDGDRDAQVVVIGSGPGGYSAAFRAADLGLKTVMIERYESLGGVCLNVGCIPSKALLHAARVVAEAEEMGAHGIRFGKPKIDLEALRTWKESVVGKLTGGLVGLAKQRNVEIVHSVARFTGPNSVRVEDRTITFDNCIIAAGSHAGSIPGLPDDPRIIHSTAALDIAEVPERLLVIGCGIIGLEMAAVYDALGSKITAVELFDQPIPGCDPDVVRPLQRRITERYEAVLLDTKVESVEAADDGLRVKLSTGDTQTFDQVLVAVGRKPNGGGIDADAAGVEVDEAGFIRVDDQLRTNVPHIYAIGDVVGGPMLAHKASHEGHIAAEVIAGVPGACFDPRSIPSVAYTDPEVAWTGLTETQAEAEGIEYEKAVFPWGASGRALSLARSEGMTKLLFEAGTHRLLGAGIVGLGAGELIAEAVHAVEMGSDAEDIALTIHPHPTLSETVGFAAEIANGTITDILPPRRRPAKTAG
jgi:dihydrolipoamide dehydrogenase